MGFGSMGAGFGRPGSMGLLGGGGLFAFRNMISFGAIGDSITRNQYTPSTGQAAAVGTAYLWTGRAWGVWACQLLGRRTWANVYAFEGYSGQRTDQILASMLSSSATVAIGVSGNTANIPYGVRATRPTYCFELSGINDQSQLVAMATAVANRVSIWTALRAAGVQPIALSLLPRDDDGGLAAAIPTWNAAIQAAATANSVPFIDIYTNCAASAGGGWKTGYTWTAGAPDVQGLHPGNEGCQSIATDIAAALPSVIGLGLNTPTMSSATTALLVRSNGSTKTIAPTSDFNGGMFPSTTGWGPRFETGGGPSSIAVGADALAQYGQALTITLPAPASGSFYSDRNGPSAITVVPGNKYAFCGRMSYAAGANTDTLFFGMQATTTAGAVLTQFGTGSGNASTAAGASLSSRDFYQEIVIPPGITTVRPWIQPNTTPGSGGTLKFAQLGLIPVV